MTPLFFGSSKNPLYGVFHPPVGTPPRNEGVLLCPPFGQEYMRSHRAYRQLALLLSKKGYAVLRFDYRGTGDSSEDIETASVDKWLEDIRTAADELKETACTDKIHVIGLRLGAILASAASQSMDIDKVVLWDTLSSGSTYDNELQIEMKKDGDDAAFNHIDSEGNLHFNGFALSGELRKGLKELNLTNQPPKAKQILQIASSENESTAELNKAWSSLPQYTYQHVAAPGNWNYVDDFGGILLPQAVIQAIVTWISH